MKKIVFVTLAVAALAGSTASYTAYAAAGDPPANQELRMETRAALLDAHLAGLKAGLKLTADQEKNWPAFEVAVRGIAKQRLERFIKMRAEREKGERPSPIDHMRMMSDRLANGSADLKALADAAQPLYASLDDNQKRDFGPLFHDFVREGRHDAMGWRHHGWREHDGGPDAQ
jgi:zinc resistance-associated protein